MREGSVSAEGICSRVASSVFCCPSIQDIVSRFGREQTEQLLKEYNISGTLEALTESEGQSLQPTPQPLPPEVAATSYQAP